MQDVKVEISLDLAEFSDQLYKAIVDLEKGNYGQAKSKMWVAWGQVRRASLSQSDQLIEKAEG